MTTQDAAPRVGRVETIRPPGGDGMRESWLTIVILTSGVVNVILKELNIYIYIIHIYISKCPVWGGF